MDIELFLAAWRSGTCDVEGRHGEKTLSSGDRDWNESWVMGVETAGEAYKWSDDAHM